jgi:hypothetical protein
MADPGAAGMDLYRGEVSLPLPLASLPGPDGFGVTLEARYSSAALETATGWNLRSPTGVLGLGWSLPARAVVADYRYGVGQPRYRLHDPGGGGRLWCTGRAPDGTLSFLCEAYAFWKITFDPAARAWRIVRENGDVYLYGGAGDAPDAIEWGVACGDWIGASGVAAGQGPVPAAFHLASISNRFGARIRFEYESVLQTVGGTGGTRPVYTQACYLRRVTGAAGDTAELHYL